MILETIVSIFMTMFDFIQMDCYNFSIIVLPKFNCLHCGISCVIEQSLAQSIKLYTILLYVVFLVVLKTDEISNGSIKLIE